MKSFFIVGAFFALVAGSAAGLLPRPMLFFHHAPTRPHTVLGPVSTLALDPEPPLHALAAAARTHRHAAALTHLTAHTLPNGSRRYTALAVVYGPYGKTAD
jgi:hypothetical protein